jgi:hypothetical protein
VLGRPATARAGGPRRGLGGWLPADELDETRIVGLWLAGHEARALELDPRPDGDAIAAFVGAERPAALSAA